jgi:hypothetical protein
MISEPTQLEEGNPMQEKCKCPTEGHGHKAGQCDQLATEPDRMCKPCHDKAAEAMHSPRPSDNQPPPRAV